VEKERRESVTFNELFKAMLDGQVGEGVDEVFSEVCGGEVVMQSSSRYVPVEVKRRVEARSGGRCSFPGCNKPSEVLHHIDRFASSKEHSSERLRPLCKCHHDIAHAGLIEGELGVSDQWKLRRVAMPCFIDKKVIAYRA